MPLKKNAKKIKVVLFDLGKVLLHFNFEPAFKRLARHTDLTPKDIEDYFVVSGLEVLYDGGKISSRRFFSEVKKGLRLRIGYAEFEKIWNGIFTPKPDTIRLLKRLEGRCKLVLVSNTNAMHYAYIHKKYRFLDVFDRHVLSFRVKMRKPDPHIYETALRHAGAKPEEAFYIDDRQDLTEAASELGIRSHTYRGDAAALERELKELSLL